MLNRNKVRSLKLLYLAFLAAPSLILLADVGSFDSNVFGRMIGIWMLSMLALQPVLSSRLKIIEKGVGLDKVTRWHAKNAKLLIALIIFHPLFIFLQPILSGLNIITLISTFTLAYWFGTITALALLGIVFSALYYRKIGLRYDQWRAMHIFAYSAVILGFVHSFWAGTDIYLYSPLFYWWVFLIGLVLLAVFNRYVLRLNKIKDNWYEIVDKKSLTHDVTSIRLKPLDGDIFDFNPGQFAFIKIKSNKISDEEHPFTISASPTEDFLQFSIKNSGDFTSKIHNVLVGDKVRVEGPYGVFSHVGYENPFVFIAGGIGITPIRSMLKYMKDSGNHKKSKLIYANRTKDDIAFSDEIKELEKENWFDCAHVLSDQEAEDCYHGYVSKEILQKEIADPENNKYFVCGPPVMMQKVKKHLKNLGVPSQNIHSEEFSLR